MRATMSEGELKSKAGTPNRARRTTRLFCSHFTRIRPVRRDSRLHEGLLEEISHTGAVLSLECPLRKGSTVRIDCKSWELRGKVTDCKRWSRGYMAEIAFPKDQPWQPTEFKPDCLFNPNYLVCENPDCAPDCVHSSCGLSPTPPAVPPRPPKAPSSRNDQASQIDHSPLI